MSFRKVFDDVSDGKLQWADMGEVYDTIVIGGDRYDLVKGRENLRKQLKGYFPGEEEAIDAYIQLVRETVFAGRFYFMEKALPPLLGKLAGPLLRRKVMKVAEKTTGEVLAGLTSNTRLQAVLAGQYGDYGLPAKRCELLHSRYGRKTLLRRWGLPSWRIRADGRYDPSRHRAKGR